MLTNPEQAGDTPAPGASSTTVHMRGSQDLLAETKALIAETKDLIAQSRAIMAAREAQRMQVSLE